MVGGRAGPDDRALSSQERVHIAMIIHKCLPVSIMALRCLDFAAGRVVLCSYHMLSERNV